MHHDGAKSLRTRTAGKRKAEDPHAAGADGAFA
jgi:hypothetical protein